MYTVYIGSTYATGNSTACIIFSALFQYTFIATLVAITVDVVDLFARLFRKLSSAYHSLAISITWSKLSAPVLFIVDILKIPNSTAHIAGSVLCCSWIQIILQ